MVRTNTFEWGSYILSTSLDPNGSPKLVPLVSGWKRQPKSICRKLPVMCPIILRCFLPSNKTQPTFSCIFTLDVYCNVFCSLSALGNVISAQSYSIQRFKAHSNPPGFVGWQYQNWWVYTSQINALRFRVCSIFLSLTILSMMTITFSLSSHVRQCRASRLQLRWIANYSTIC